MQQCDQELSVRGIFLENCADLHNKELHEPVTSATSRTLELLKLDRNFIVTNDPEDWNDSPVYIRNKSTVSSLKVVSDIAAHSTALMSHFNMSITKKESEMQGLIQVVDDHRQRVPDSSK